MKEKRLAGLFGAYIRKELNAAEEGELMVLLADPGMKGKLEEIFDEFYDSQPGGWVMRDEQAEEVFRRVASVASPAKVVRRRFSVGLAMTAVAASIVLFFGIYFLFFNKTTKKQDQIVATDVKAPTGTKAEITLADGSRVSIDSLTTLVQGNVKLTKTADGKIIYDGENNEVVYNTLMNPRGSKVVDLTLSDGTRVWLNAESSLKYPVAFVGKERMVEITGEAYFEAPQPPKGGASFKVIANGITIEDLGTEFNVNSYTGTKTTLVKGVVKIGSLILKPGEQANNDKLLGAADLRQVLAWKNNEFVFESASIEEIIEELERWYDVKVELQDKIDNRFTGVISRNVNMSEVFTMLQNTGALIVTIENKKVTITK